MKKKEQPGFTPDWARDAIWYQIFPERFRNGAPQSNPKPEDISDRPLDHWQMCEWGRDWYRPTEWEQTHAHGRRWGVFSRRYGGDLVGIREKLDYLQTLGVNALYLNPVFTARSLHKYDGATFHHVDPTFGPDREGDLKLLAAAEETEDPETWIWTAADRYLLDLVRDVHDRGMRIILDGVFNHTGCEFFAFQDLLRHGPESRYADWYLLEGWNARGEPEYKGWFSHKSLPEFNRSRTNLVEPVKQYIFDCTRRWMDPDQDGERRKGIDGWRLDVAFCVPHGFWREWRIWVKSINPDAYLTAEIVSLGKDYVKGDQFDAVMNYMWLFPVVDYFAPAQHPISTPVFKRKLDRLRRVYHPSVTPVLQNLLDSHDVARVGSMMENPDVKKLTWDDYFHVSRLHQNPDFIPTQPGPAAISGVKLATIFQMTYIGAPMIYYGNEVGMWGANDPDNRQPMLWEDIAYESETHTPAGRVAAQPRQPDRALFDFFRQAIALRHQYRALRRGSFAWIPTRRRRLLAFERRQAEERLRIWLNTAGQPITVKLSVGGHDVWAHQPVAAGAVEIPARGWLILSDAVGLAEP